MWRPTPIPPRETAKDIERLVIAHRPVVLAEVGKWCKRYGRARNHHDDLVQEGMEALVYAVRKWKPSLHRAMPFGNYAKMWVRARVLSAVLRLGPVALSRRYSFAQAAQLRSESVDEASGLMADHHEPNTLHPEELVREMRQVLKGSTRTHRAWRGPLFTAQRMERDIDCFIRNRFFGETLKALGDEYGCSRERIRQVVERVEEKFEQWAREVREEAA